MYRIMTTASDVASGALLTAVLLPFGCDDGRSAGQGTSASDAAADAAGMAAKDAGAGASGGKC